MVAYPKSAGFAAALLVNVLCVDTSGAEDKASLGNYGHLKSFEALIGTWTGEFQSPHDRPTANIKKGDKITLTSTWKWHLDKSTIMNHQTMGVPGSDPVWQGTFFIGWDAANKRVICFAFENTGGHQVIDDWEIQADKMTAKGKGCDPFGGKTTFTMILSEINRDSHARKFIDTYIDGVKQPDYDTVTLKRVKAK